MSTTKKSNNKKNSSKSAKLDIESKLKKEADAFVKENQSPMVTITSTKDVSSKKPIDINNPLYRKKKIYDSLHNNPTIKCLPPRD